MKDTQKKSLLIKKETLEVDYQQAKRAIIEMSNRVQFEKRQNVHDLEGLYQRYQYVMKIVGVDYDQQPMLNQLTAVRIETDMALNQYQQSIEEQLTDNENNYRKAQRNITEELMR